MQYTTSQIISLVKKDYQHDLSLQYQVDGYIRELRKIIVQQQNQLDFLLKTESYMPYIETLNIPFDDIQVELSDISHLTTDFLALTLTLDPSKFPQLMFTPYYDQIKYFKKIFSKLIIDEHISGVYGSFEKHASGNIHCHCIIPIYATQDNINQLTDFIRPYLTNRTNNKHAILIKPVTDASGWFKYINKQTDFKEFMEYNILKKTLEKL